MTTKDTPLLDIYYPQGTGIPKEVLGKLAPRSTLKGVLPDFGAEFVKAAQNDISDNRDKLLQVTPLDILVDGWAKHKEVAEALADSKKEPNKPITKSLLTHTINSEHFPYLEMYLDEKPVWKLEFVATVSLEIEGASLEIQNGIITKILTGTCQGKFNLSYSDQVLVETETKKFKLPGVIPVNPDRIKPNQKPATIAHLTGVSGELAGQAFDLNNHDVIGRSSKSSIRLSGSSISRSHARFFRDENYWYVEDLNSALGLSVNGWPVKKAALKDGDKIRIGDAEFIFVE